VVKAVVESYDAALDHLERLRRDRVSARLRQGHS
jgi:hypothetical protein